MNRKCGVPLWFFAISSIAVLAAAGCGDADPSSGSVLTAWTAIPVTGLSEDAQIINGVAYGEGKGFIAAGGPGGSAITSRSANGIDGWVKTEIPAAIFASYPGKIAYVNTSFLITRGSSYTTGAYSSDGITWKKTGIGFGTKAFAYGNNVYFVGGQHGQAAWSTDLQTWKKLEKEDTTFSGDFSMPYINAAAFGNGKFVIGGGQGHIAWSTDGTVWQGVTDVEVVFDKPSGLIDCMAYGGGKFVALGGMDGNDAKSAYSSDGMQWQYGGAPHLGANNGSPVMEYGGGLFVAGDDQGRGSYSTDGITWTPIADTTFDGTPIKGIAYGNGMFVMVGGEGKAAYARVKQE
jgi:hypothetical protein